MSLIGRIDLALLVRTDAFVGWNRDRGRADQWLLAAACLDMSIALVIAALLIETASNPGVSPLSQSGYIVIAFLFGFLRSRELRSISELSAKPEGAMQARVGEEDARRTNIVVMMALLAMSAISFGTSDIAFLLAVATMGAAHYFKAAEPPPPATRREDTMAPTG